MSETRKNHLNIDGGQVTADENIASYKPIPEHDPELNDTKKLTKSKEKVSDEAEEKLLKKEDEARITTRVDMADAKYIVEDHRNGSAKIELDANKKQFSGLTKEELLKYADDPFWVRLRWLMFVLFWALWVCMLAGAIAIIIQAPKCAAPTPKQWFEKGPIIDLFEEEYLNLSEHLPLLKRAGAQGVFVNGDALFTNTYDILEDDAKFSTIKGVIAEAKTHGIRVIISLTANYVSNEHRWFKLSENRSSMYNDYFVWAKGSDFDETGTQRKPPNNWISTVNMPAWSESDVRNEFYLHQYESHQPDLNFTNPEVVKQFDNVLIKWMQAGVAGVRLYKARQLLVNGSFPDEPISTTHSVGLDEYQSLQHRYTSDQPGLDDLLQHWAHIVDSHAVEEPNTGASVFTLFEDGDKPELWLLERNTASLRPPSAASIDMRDTMRAHEKLTSIQKTWPAVHLDSDQVAGLYELAPFAMLLPATPVLRLQQITSIVNSTMTAEWLSRLLPVRVDASVEHGNVSLVPLGSNTVLACLRWKAGHTGYAAVWNGGFEEARANLTALPSVPASLTVLYASPITLTHTNYTINHPVDSDDLIVPPVSTVLLSYVPNI